MIVLNVIEHQCSVFSKKKRKVVEDRREHRRSIVNIRLASIYRRRVDDQWSIPSSSSVQCLFVCFHTWSLSFDFLPLLIKAWLIRELLFLSAIDDVSSIVGCIECSARSRLRSNASHEQLTRSNHGRGDLTETGIALRWLRSQRSEVDGQSGRRQRWGSQSRWIRRWRRRRSAVESYGH